MRLDKFLCEMNMGSRSQVRELVRQGRVTVNGETAVKPERKVDELSDHIVCQGRELSYRPFVYYMLNKPGGVVSATRDGSCKTVLDFIDPGHRKGLFPVGRLDKDTEGLLLLTNDGGMSHRLLSPGRHVDKVYLVRTPFPLTDRQLKALAEGVDIGEGKPTRPGKADLMEDGCLRLTIHEGKFHQVKRMVHAVGSEVLALKRIAFGGVMLDGHLQPGESRLLTEREIGILHEQSGQP